MDPAIDFLLSSPTHFRHVTLNSEFGSLLDSNQNTDFSDSFPAYRRREECAVPDYVLWKLEEHPGAVRAMGGQGAARGLPGRASRAERGQNSSARCGTDSCVLCSPRRETSCQSRVSEHPCGDAPAQEQLRPVHRADLRLRVRES